MPITYNLETITPAIAHKLLEGNSSNRKLSRRLISRYTGYMKRNEWNFNGESIKLNGAEILDGQHRLHACIDANKSFKTLVIRGLHHSAKDTIDTGLARTNTHHLQMKGEGPKSPILASAIGHCIKYSNGEMHRRDKVSHIQINNFLEINPGIRDSAERYGKKGVLGGPNQVVAAHYIFSRVDPEAADSFMDMFTTGAGLEKGSPILTLRNRLIKDVGTEHKLQPATRVAFFIKAWNAWRKGGRLAVLRHQLFGEKREKFPEAI